MHPITDLIYSRLYLAQTNGKAEAATYLKECLEAAQKLEADLASEPPVSTERLRQHVHGLEFDIKQIKHVRDSKDTELSEARRRIQELEAENLKLKLEATADRDCRLVIEAAHEIARLNETAAPVSTASMPSMPSIERRTLCCNYPFTDANPPVYWNDFNGVVQCHSCGHIYAPAPLEEALS